MVLDLKPVFAVEGSELPFHYSLDLSGFELSPGQYPFRTPITVQGRAANRAGLVTLEVNAELDYDTECDRCCKSIREHYRFPMKNVLVREMAGEDSDDLILVADESLDVDEYVTSGVILALPSRHLCSSDCKGLCPHCGKDLNEGPCGCESQDTRPAN